jgi:predicted nucleic acid-binding protein
MIKAFLDTNILVDLIGDRKPFSKHVIEIFKHAEEKKITLFTSSHSIATVYYILKKYVADKELKEILLNLLDFIDIIEVNLDVLKKALRSNHKDFEDAIQMICASRISGMNYIITRNTKDFKTSEIMVLSPDEMCLKF